MAITLKASGTWWKGDLNLFRIGSDGEAEFLSSATIRDIFWECPDRAVVWISGLLPEADSLLNVKTGDTLEILRKFVGPRHKYSEGEVVIRIKKVEQLNWSLPDLVALSAEENTVAELHLNLVGKLEWVTK